MAKFKYKVLTPKVTSLPVGGITLIPNTDLETDVDLKGYVKVGYLKDLNVGSSAPKVEEVVEDSEETVEPKKSFRKKK